MGAHRRMWRVVAVAALALLVAAACGQKAGVHVTGPGRSGAGDGATPGTGGDFEGGGGGFEGGDGGDGGVAGGDGGVVPSDEAPRGGAGGEATAGGGGTTGDGTTAPRSGRGVRSGGGGSAGGGAAPSGPAWGNTIVIGIHAPITGAAPLPSSFAEATKVYPEWINARGGINGRRVAVQIVDDEYQPATAVQRCRELVERGNAFLLVGGGGTDQIQACARFAESAGVPYLSAGVTERGLRDLQGYFALSMSYKQQGAYLARYIQQQWPDRADNPAMVYSDTPNFQDAVQGFVGTMGNVKEYQLSRVPSSTELANRARQMCIDGVEVAYPLMAPKDWLTMLRAITCDIQWAGVGLTMGLNAVASVGCKDTPEKFDGSTFFSPFPGVDVAPRVDPEFAQAVQGKDWDDIYVALWTVSKAIGELLRQAGQQLTRAGFVQQTEQVQGLRVGMNPTLSYTPEDHFGASEVHVLQARCQGSSGQYVTADTFARF